MSLGQSKIMLGLRVRVIRGTYLGRTGTITDIMWDDPDFRDYAESVVIRWDKQFSGRRNDEWWDYNALEEITQPDEGLLHPLRMQVGWKVRLYDMPRSKFHNKVGKISEIVRTGDNKYFVVNWGGERKTKWQLSLASLYFVGVPKKLSAKKAKKLEREALLSEIYH